MVAIKTGSRQRLGSLAVRDGAPDPDLSAAVNSGTADSGALVATRFLLPATIRMVDEERREIEVCAAQRLASSTICGQQ